MANYAIIKIEDSVETVDNIIVAEAEVAALYLVVNGGDYDYVVDTSLYSPSPDIGDTYDPILDVFIPPAVPPVDHIAVLRADINAIHYAIAQALLDSEGMGPEDITAAYEESESDLDGLLSTSEPDIMDAVATLLLAGG